MNAPSERNCTRCGLTKPAADFVRRRRRTPLTSHCNACRSQQQAIYSDGVKEKHDAAFYQALDWSQPRTCKDCGELKRCSDFHKARRFKDGLAIYCIPCARARQRATPNRSATSLAYRVAHPLQKMVYSVRSSAKKRGLACTITPEDIFVPERCPVLGIPLVQSVGTKSRVDGTVTIDRIDNSKGYVPGNIMVVSWRANRLKKVTRRSRN